MITRSRVNHALLAAALGLLSTAPAFADDTEIYANAASPTTSIRPNILLIVDTSNSMGGRDVRNERAPYVPGNTYGTAENCKDGRIFYRQAGEGIPECSSTHFFETVANHCKKLADAVKGIAGRWTGKVAQWDAESGTWRPIRNSTDDIECAADDGVHGHNDAATAATHAKNDAGEKWTSNADSTINWSQIPTYTFYGANWLNWRRVTPATADLTRLEAVKNAVTSLASSLDSVNIGMMRFGDPTGLEGDAAASGALVTNPVESIDANREALIANVNSFKAESATPLSEALHEAYLYLAGKPILFGDASVPSAKDPPDAASTQYKSPITHQCQRNFTVLLTDGRPFADNETDDEIAQLRGGACDLDEFGTFGDERAGTCLDDMAEYLNDPDTDLSPLPGRQSAVTYTIAFGNDVAGTSFLTDVATVGGGRRFDAANTDELAEAFAEITNDILNVSSTFATAAIGVSAFNRASSRDDLYFGVFSAGDKVRWDGNLKKYRLMVDSSTNPPRLIIADQSSRDAIDPQTGFFRTGALSFWSTPPADGNRVTVGGAVSKLPADRKVLTFLGANPEGTATALIPITDASVNNAVLGVADDTMRELVLDFARSVDIKRMGDPLHSIPAVVTYGGTPEAPQDYVYLATNDGYLHAFDAASGEEKWAFVPKEMLPRLKELYVNPAATSRTYGLDGEIRVLRLDRNNDGAIKRDEGDRVWLYIGMRRGGNRYYGLDVTDPVSPQLLFSIGPSELPGIGETWSTPTIARVDIKDLASQNTQDLVLIFGGGYDGVQENYVQVDDSVGNRIFMVDAKSGELLWFAGARNGTLDEEFAGKFLEVPAMKNSIPSRVTVLDTDGDLYADRMYVGDMGGRVFRFDIFSGEKPDTLVSGGVFASLGQGDADAPSITHTRRFYNAPDVALVQRRGEDPYYNIAIGSGYRGHPLHKETEDRFYSLRDKEPFTKFRDYSARTIIKDSDEFLEDITGDGVDAAVPREKSGWKLRLVPAAGVTRGEKVLADATTVNGVILFTTYEPAESVADPCIPSSINRVYAVRVDNGRPALNLNALDAAITDADLFTEIKADGILGPVNVGLIRGELAEQLGAAPGTARSVCLAGMHILGTCVQVSDTVRTFWRKDADPEEE